MTALPTDFSVTSNKGASTPTPAWPIDSPFAVTAVSGASIADPDALSAVSIGSISSPVAWSPEAMAGISSPSALSSVSGASIAAPTANTPQSAAAISTPAAITATTGTATTPPFPLNHARILYDNLLLNYSSVTASAGTNGSYALVPNTYKKWSVTTSSTVTLTIELPSNVDMDTFCIGAHNLWDGGTGNPWLIQYDSTTGGSFTTVGSGTPTSNAPIMVHLSSTVSVRRVRFTISSAPIREKTIGYVSAGVALQLQRPFFGGHTPITMADNTVYRNNMTDGGEFTSRSIIRKGFSNNVSLDNVDRTWIQNYFLDFKEVSKEYLYFIAWNLLEYPNEVGLCMTGGDISLQFSGTRDLMSINWSQTGHGSV